MGEQHAAGDVADGVDGRVGGLLLVVDVDEPLVVEGNLGVFQAEVLGVRSAAHGNEDAVVKLLLLLAVRLGLDLDLFAAGGHLADLGLEADLLEGLLGVGHDGPGEIGVRAGQNAVQRLDKHDLAAERGIDGPQLHADVAAADDQQVLRDVLHFQGLGRSHHARIAQVERLGHGGFGADGDDGVVVIDELLALLGLDAQGLRIFEITASMHDLHAAHLGQLRDAAGKPGQNGFLPRPQFRDVDARRGEGMPRCSDSRAEVMVWAACSERLRGDAAAG